MSGIGAISKFECERIRIPCDVARLDAGPRRESPVRRVRSGARLLRDSEVVLGGGANRAKDEVADREDDQAAADEESWTNNALGIIVVKPRWGFTLPSGREAGLHRMSLAKCCVAQRATCARGHSKS